MIYLTQTDKEAHNIHFFLSKIDMVVARNSYLILVIADPDDQNSFGRQIQVSRLGEVNWLLTTSSEFDALVDQYGKPFLSLFLGEITLTKKGDAKMIAHAWELLSIAPEHKNAPFNGAFAELVNNIVDQMFYNSDSFGSIKKSRFQSLMVDLMNSGMFKMISDPREYYGVG